MRSRAGSAAASAFFSTNRACTPMLALEPQGLRDSCDLGRTPGYVGGRPLPDDPFKDWLRTAIDPKRASLRQRRLMSDDGLRELQGDLKVQSQRFKFRWLRELDQDDLYDDRTLFCESGRNVTKTTKKRMNAWKESTKSPSGLDRRSTKTELFKYYNVPCPASEPDLHTINLLRTSTEERTCVVGALTPSKGDSLQKGMKQILEGATQLEEEKLRKEKQVVDERQRLKREDEHKRLKKEEEHRVRREDAQEARRTMLLQSVDAVENERGWVKEQRDNAWREERRAGSPAVPTRDGRPEGSAEGSTGRRSRRQPPRSLVTPPSARRTAARAVLLER